MRIVIDMQGAQSSGSRGRGIGRYSTSLTQAVLRNNTKHDILVVLNAAFYDTIDPIKEDLFGLIPLENVRVWHPMSPVSHNGASHDQNRKIAQRHREAFLAELNPDLILVTSLFEGLVDDAVTSVSEQTNLPTAVILYDLIPYINKDVYLENPVVKRWYVEKVDYLQKANLLLAISQSSANEAMDYLSFNPDFVANISTAAEKHFKPTAISTDQEKHIRERYGLLQNFVMYTGGIDHRKNIEGLIKSYANLPKDLRKEHQLAIVCSIQSDAKERLTQLSKSVGLNNSEIVFTGFVPEEDLVALYNLCTLFVFPSWHEGFGLPALEAMQCGKPVIAANTSSLPEVVGLEEALFDPKSEEAIAEKLYQAMTDAGFRERLAQHGLQQVQKFSWDITGVKAIKAIETWFLQQKKEMCLLPLVKPKMAFISPLPPERSGISDYSAELLRVLIEYYDIEVVVNQEAVFDDWIVQNYSVRTIEYFQENYLNYERVIYHFGNSHFHQHMFGLLSQYPGLVVLHDFYLGHIQEYNQSISNPPNALDFALYSGHGYKALNDRTNLGIENAVWQYPCSLPVLQDALGVIVHSENSGLLAKNWYGKDAAYDWSVIPLLRTPASAFDKNNIREKYGYQSNDILICSFGIVGPTKLNHRLLESFLSSGLIGDKRVHLVFVGDNHPGKYGQDLIEKIKTSKLDRRIKITGWADESMFKDYLAMADIGVQLRTLSRGETSAAVLDCMNYELATIVNANGSMGDLAPSGVMMLPDEFTDEQLVSALTSLVENVELREQLGKRAKEIITTKHDPKVCTEQYVLAIEKCYLKNKTGLYGLMNKIASEALLNQSNILTLSAHLQNDFPPSIHKKQLLVDISVLVQIDAKSGIQRVVRSVLKEWFTNPPGGYAVEPVYASSDTQGYLYARKFTCQFLDIPSEWIEDEPIDAWVGDVFVALDLQHHVLPTQSDFLKQLTYRGVVVKTVVYDLLPILLPHVFAEGAQSMHQIWLETTAKFDGVVCISKAVADEYQAWLLEQDIKIKKSFSVDWFHLGADIDVSHSSTGLPANLKQILKQLKSAPSFLMVGTLEPRKGHAQTLQAFEILWADGFEINLVIVGKQGWMVENLIENIRNHSKINKRLFWLEGTSDEFLEQVYSASRCLIAASEGEGFGLPLIEAAQKQLPIIARELNVFKEVAGQYAYYFEDSKQPEIIASAVQKWLELYKTNQHPKSDNMPWLTWKKSAEQLLKVLDINIEEFK